MKNYMIVLLGKRNPFGYYDNCCNLWNKFGRVYEELYDCFTRKTESFGYYDKFLVCEINLGAYMICGHVTFQKFTGKMEIL